MASGMGNSYLYKRKHECAGEASDTVCCTKIISRKRVIVPLPTEELTLSSPFRTPFQKRHARRSRSEALNHLELLPQDILIRVLCHVDHSDLKRLVCVSKAIHDAALIAKESHFAFKTPVSKLKFNGDSRSEILDEFDTHDAPNAPRRNSRTRFAGKDLASISVALFTSSDEL